MRGKQGVCAFYFLFSTTFYSFVAISGVLPSFGPILAFFLSTLHLQDSLVYSNLWNFVHEWKDIKIGKTRIGVLFFLLFLLEK